ncbi:T7SS effector LXG polymorphic toxin [Guptibacillus hwajinpoensis]|uniref:T7SS effector LXG polymorphic toxin n=1 Tax=Guptibacillus hwajinpoensis TaxID=208199 RepID=UPI001CD211FE|nr:T7SS effector LXG polymorphic toxin [Pseudalkalibacillus hwajinpoensis]MCA0991419.1 hypothetical protein [Pseudalkalibacillus hwajinpoensis]
MKTLEVESFLSGIELTLKQLDSQENDIKKIDSSVMEFVQLEEALKGKGGQAIRSFYQDCHVPFLQFYQSTLNEYKNALHNIKNDLQAFESSSTATIREDFLENDLDHALKKIKTITTDLSNEATSIINSVSDIIMIQTLQDSNVMNHLNSADEKINQTIEQLHQYDRQQVKNLDGVVDRANDASGYVEQISSMFQSNQISVEGYQPGSLFQKLKQAVQSPGGIATSVQGSINNENSTSKRALDLLLDYEESKNIKSTTKPNEDDSLVNTLLDGAIGSIAPLAIMTASHKSGILRIEYTKKKNHYAFKYDRKVLHFLKGRTGPEWTKRSIQKVNKLIKDNHIKEKNLKYSKKNFSGPGKFVDNRTQLTKAKSSLIKLTTGNRPLHENVKNKLIKHSSREMVISKGAFKKVAARTSGVAAVVIGMGTSVKNIFDRWENGENLSGPEQYEANGRIVGEELNKVAGSVAGATTGAYVGAIVGGALSGPFAPFGAAAGAIVGSAIGGAVGEWASKYTKKWASNAGEEIGKVTYKVKESAKDALESVKDTLNESTDKLFGWI